jgi:hypothetical protein
VRHMKRVLNYLFSEPLLWLFYWCFQPDKFARTFAINRVSKRIGFSLRLILPIFLIETPLVLCIRIALRYLLVIPSPDLTNLIFSIIITTLAGIVLGLLAGTGLGLTGSINIGLASGISFGLVIGSIDSSSEVHILAGMAAGLVVTCMLGVAGTRVGNDTVFGIVAGIIAGVATGLLIHFTIGDDVAGMIISCMVGMTTGITVSRRKTRPRGGAHPRARSLIIGAILTGVMTVLNTWTGGATFALTFLLIFYRLPVYPVSGFSSWKALRASRKHPSQVFTYLHASSLYWDENVYLPLPGLKQMLTIAAEHNIARALEEVTFIVMERPLQIEAARTAALEIAFHDLTMRDTLKNIAGASSRLSEIFPLGTGLIDPQWSRILIHLHDASQNAAQASSPVGWQTRYNALEAMHDDLKQLHPNSAFNDIAMNGLLGDIMTLWQEVAGRELETLENAPEKTRRVSNPYNPGPALERHNKLFVGRYDLASQLGEALAKKDHRPTFLLYGERRMGKSCVLKQLPDLLSARFLPIFYDLQSPDSTSSIAAFLGMVAEEIVLAMESRGLKAKKLEYERLKEAHRENEAAVYYVFNRWLRGIEKTLEREDRTLLLMFDEFEKLDRSDKERYLQLELLLDWFRSIMQHHPRLALLFSGVQTFGELGINWAGYFVNVQTLKVSFLQPSEAYQLITQPIQGIPSEQIFGQGVIEEILRITNGHPFLVQALSSALIDALNARRRNQIELQDVARAINAVFKNWGSTYFRDLWDRTNEAQRICLSVLKSQGSSDLSSIEQQCGLDRQIIYRALEMLLDRDLVCINEQHSYQLAAPIFDEWVARHEAVLQKS